VTERLYYTDPYITEFSARIVRIADHQGRTAAILDRTAFYPTSGGQPHDTGTLGRARVVEVVDGEDGTILHVLEGTAAEGDVEARID
jgi:alanyl-tRNA synthetase